VAVQLRAIEIVRGGAPLLADADRKPVLRIDAKTREVTATIPIGSDVSDLAVGFGSVWVAGGDDGTLSRIDPVTNGVAREPVSQPVRWVATAPTGRQVGVSVTSGNQLLLIDPDIDAIVSSTEIPAPTGLAVGDDVWVTTQDDRFLRASGLGYAPTSVRASFSGGLAGACAHGQCHVRLVHRLRRARADLDRSHTARQATPLRPGRTVAPGPRRSREYALVRRRARNRAQV
jgi:hypothetical protein